MASLIAIIGAGPSLDYAEHELWDLLRRGATFLISDSVAAAFARKFSPRDVLVFTVEMRRHLYLTRLAHAHDIWAYHKAPAQNLRAHRVNRFKIRGETEPLPELYSPGTVLGTMLSYAIRDGAMEIHIFGADFCYVENQVYARFIDPHAPAMNRLRSRELWQLEMTYKKTGGVLMKNDLPIRTSFELMQARENMRGFIDQLPERIRLIEYSPIGFDSERVQKQVPRNV